jgi:glycosyltransferase involved in cell wall biosynthesis
MSPHPQPLVSVVTPVYNGAQYIQECVESVLAQTYQNWEYIIANNCSTDRTLEIVTSYAKRHPQIRVYNNERLVNARQNHNRAVSWISSESKYCKLLHADDWLFPHCLEMMVRVNEAHPSVGIVGSYGLAGDRVVGDGLSYGTEVVPGRELARLALLTRLLPFYSPSSLLIRSNLVRQRDPFYDEECIHADHKACYEMLRNCDYGFVHQVLTYIRRHADSTTSTTALPIDMWEITNLDLLTRYGPEFLTREEFEKRLSKKFSAYYRVMARRFIENREKAYWNYHRQGLQKLGYRFDFLQVLSAILQEFMAHPRWIVRTMYQSAGRKISKRHACDENQSQTMYRG